MIAATAPPLATATLPADPVERYRVAALFTGMYIVLVSGDFALEGRLIEIMRPDLSLDIPAPNIVVDTGRAHVRGPLLAGDILVA